MIFVLIAAGVVGGLLGYLLGKDRGYNEGVNDAKALDVQINKLDALVFKGKPPEQDTATKLLRDMYERNVFDWPAVQRYLMPK